MHLKILTKSALSANRYKFYTPVLLIFACFAILLFSIALAASPGDLDPSFGNGGIVLTSTGDGRLDTAAGTAIQTDGKIVVLASTRNPSIDENNTLLIRYNTDGTLDSAFGSGGKTITDISGSGKTNYPQAVEIQTDGKIVVAGSIYNGVNFDIAVARFNTNGSLDNSFGNGGKIITQVGSANDTCAALALQADGKIIVAGQTSSATSDFVLVRYNPNGSLDSTFSGGIVITDFNGQSEEITAVKIQTDGKIVAIGESRPVGTGNNDFALARYNPDGTLDINFAGGGKLILVINAGIPDSARGAAIQTDGKIIAVGYGPPMSSGTEFLAARINTNGTLDSNFGTNGIVRTAFAGSGSAKAVALQTDGKIIVAGLANGKFAIIRYNPNGSLDTGFGAGGIANFPNGDVGAVVIQPDDKIVAAGSINVVPIRVVEVVRYLTDSNIRPTVFDFDGDGKTDVSIFRPSLGEWWYLRSSNGGNGALAFGTSTDRLTPGDFTGDGKTDIAFFRPSTGFWYVLRSEDSSFFGFPFGTSGDIPAPSDYDGDGKTDAAVFRPSVATWFILRSSDGGTTISSFGTSTDKPIPADYDGDGKADIAIWRPSVGEWWYAKSSTGQTAALQFGTSTDKPVQGDYTGDGRSDIAFFRPSTGEWFILRSEDNSFFSFPFGASGDIPTPGDYDGDGKADAAVFRPSNSTWFANRSTAGILIAAFGTSGDVPVPGAFVP